MDFTRFDPDWLACLAYLGHPDATAHLAEGAPSVPDDLRDWILGFEEWGDEIAVRALLALAGLRRAHALELPVNGVPSAEGLVRCPCQEHERKARIAWSRDAPWSGDFAWAELAAEFAWDTSWKTSVEVVREEIRQALVPWALDEGAA